MTNPLPSRDLTRTMLVVLFFVALIVANFFILKPFLPAFIWAVTIVVATWPLMLRLQTWLGGKRGFAVAVMTLALLLILIIPFTLAIVTLLDNADMIKGSQTNANDGVAVAAQVGELLTAISDSVDKVTGLAGEVAAASEEQSQGIEQVNSAVAQMDRVTQANAANAEESASASEELSAQARELFDMVTLLQAAVRGSSAGGPVVATAGQGLRSKLMSQGTPAHLTQHALEGHGDAAPAKHPAVLRPEQVIPLDDDDLQGF